VALIAALHGGGNRPVKPPPFDYIEPDDLDSAVAVLAADDEALALAGGQSLVPMLNFKLASPTTLVGLRRLGLNRIERSDDEVRVGAMTTQSEGLGSEQLRSACPLVVEALRQIGHPQIRSRGTIGGTTAHADPAAEIPAALLALDAAVVVRGPEGTRAVSAQDLYRGPYMTSLRTGELITEVVLPVAEPRTGAACVEVTRRAGDFALAGVACQLALSADEVVADARIALFAIAGQPRRARAAEARLAGAAVTDAALTEAGSLALDEWGDQAGATEDGRYRVRVVPAIVRRALAAAVERAR
jgi:aerobic carbon-monoxide dehydrogenase medium subunit